MYCAAIHMYRFCFAYINNVQFKFSSLGFFFGVSLLYSKSITRNDQFLDTSNFSAFSSHIYKMWASHRNQYYYSMAKINSHFESLHHTADIWDGFCLFEAKIKMPTTQTHYMDTELVNDIWDIFGIYPGTLYILRTGCVALMWLDT